MNYYLSSYKIGNKANELKLLISQTKNKKIAIIPNAADYIGADLDRNKQSIEENSLQLIEVGAKVGVVDLKQYFGKNMDLEKAINEFDGVYVTGGNTFVLRQAMKLSGMDKVILSKRNIDFLYIAYSAGVCVLCPSLKPFSIVDDPNNFPYTESNKTIWDGLNILPFTFEPHYKSDHPESADVDREVEYCINNKILFKAYKDGEVLITSDQELNK